MPTSDPLLDLEQLLTPISPGNPCGESLRWDPKWDELTNLRRTRTDPLDPSGNKDPDWGKLVSVSTELLEKRVKDLQLAGWLTEALLRTAGFAGLRDGLKLIHGFVDHFWDGLHPLPDDQDFSTRAAPLIWLTQADGGARMPVLVNEVPLNALVVRPDEPVYNWKFWSFRRVTPQGKEEDAEDYKRRCAEAEKNKLEFDAAIDAAPLAVLQTLMADMDECLAEIQVLGPLLDERLTSDLAPNWNKLRDSIEEIRLFVHGVLERRGGLPKSATETTVAPEEHVMSATQSNGQGPSSSGPIRSRADAIIRLEEAARYFSESEPHSPVAHLVRRAVRWAGMPFEAVIGELVKDDNLVRQISETLGIVSDSE